MCRRLWLAFVLGSTLNLALTAAASADNCSSKSDCLQTAGFNRAVAITGAVLAATMGLAGPAIAAIATGGLKNAPPDDPSGLADLLAERDRLCSDLSRFRNMAEQGLQQLWDMNDRSDLLSRTAANCHDQIRYIRASWQRAATTRKLSFVGTVVFGALSGVLWWAASMDAISVATAALLNRSAAAAAMATAGAGGVAGMSAVTGDDIANALAECDKADAVIEHWEADSYRKLADMQKQCNSALADANQGIEKTLALLKATRAQMWSQYHESMPPCA